MNSLFVVWGAFMLLVCAIGILWEDNKKLKNENKNLRDAYERDHKHCETKMAYAEFCADAKVLDFEEEAKKHKMIAANYRKELERLKTSSGS